VLPPQLAPREGRERGSAASAGLASCLAALLIPYLRDSRGRGRTGVLCSTLRLVGARPAAPRLAGIGRLRETANQIVNRQARYNYRKFTNN
jgi:hypothetical protein